MNYEEMKTGLKGLLDKSTDPSEIEALTNLLKGAEGLEADDKSKSDLIERQAKSIKDLFLNSPAKADPNPSPAPIPAPEEPNAPKSFGEIVEQILGEKTK